MCVCACVLVCVGVRFINARSSRMNRIAISDPGIGRRGIKMSGRSSLHVQCTCVVLVSACVCARARVGIIESARVTIKQSRVAASAHLTRAHQHSSSGGGGSGRSGNGRVI